MKIMKRIMKIILETLGVMIAFCVVALGLVVWMLYANPVDVRDFIPTLSDKVLPKNSGLHLDAETAQLGTSFDGDGLFYIKIENLSVLKSDNTPAFHLSEVKLSYTLLNVIGFNYVPRMIHLEKPSLALTIAPDGSLKLYDETEQNTEKKSSGTGVSFGPAQHQYLVKNVWEYLNSLSLTDASVVIDDQQLKQKISLLHFNFDMVKEWGYTYAIKTDAVVNFQNQETHLSALAEFQYLTQQLAFEIDADKLLLKNYGRFVPVLAGADLTVNAKIRGAIGLGTSCADFVSCFKQATFQINTVEAGTLNLPDPLTNLYKIKKLTINGAVSQGLGEIKIAKSKLHLSNGVKADLEIDITGLGEYLSGGPLDKVKTVLKSDISALPIETVPEVWPSAIGPDAHAWVKQNLSKGQVEWAKFTLYFTGDNLDDLYGEMPVRDIQVRYLDEMTPVAGFTGFIKLYPDKLLITGKSGHVNQLKIQDAVIDLTELDQNVSHAHIVLKIDGPVRDAMELISQKPLEYPQMFGLKASETSGKAKVDVDLAFPLIDDLETSQVKVKIDSQIKDASFPTGLDDYVLKDAAFDLSVSSQKLSLAGQGTIKTVPLRVKWVENFEATKQTDVSSEYEFDIQTTGKRLEKVWPDITNYINGDLIVSGQMKRLVSKAASGQFKIDLTPSTITLYPTTIQKAQGILMSMDLSLSVPKNAKKTQLDIGLNGFADSNKKQPITVNSKINFGDVLSVQVDKMVSPKTNLSGHFKWKEGKILDVKLHGKSLDLSVENPNKKEQKTPTTPAPKAEVKAIQNINLDVRCDKLILRPDRPFTNITISGNKSDYFWNSLSASAVGKDPININYQASKSLLTAHYKDFGDLLERLNAADKIDGGAIDISLKQSSKGNFDGTMTVKNFKLKNPGFLIQAFTILGIVDAFRGKDLEFEKAILPITITQEPGWRVNINEGYMSGNSLGVTFTGYVSPKYLELTGSVIPAYMVNSLLGKIPLVGGLFRNGEGGGLVGVRYDLKGLPGNPMIEFQTLSSLAPGILGKLF